MSFTLQKGDMIDKYCIERCLGSGGMGAVYLVRHKQLNALRAMKVLHSSAAEEDPEFRERFIREAKFAAKIQHPNIVSVMDVELESDSGFSYIVMEYIEGQTVADILQRGPISEKQAIHIIIEAAKGLAYAAENGIVHRDIKPANLMITKTGEVKLADMGIAKNLNHTGNTISLTMEGTMIGTPAYASPEQCRCARDVDTRADIYSLGATLYEMLTGKAPFSGKNEFDVIAKVLKRMPVPIEQLAPNTRQGIIKLVRKMMAKDPADRPQTMLDLLNELYKFERPEDNMLQPLQRKLIEKRAEEVAQQRLSVILKTTIKARQKKLVFYFAAGFILVLAFSAGAFFYYKNRPIENTLTVSGPVVIPQNQDQQLKIMEDSKRGIVFDKNLRVLKRFPAGLNLTEYTIPAGITRIENMAFAENKNLKKVIIPDTVTSIGDKAFLDCTALEEVMIPDSITKLNSQVFSGCTALKNITLPDSLTAIDERAFSCCSSLETIVLPAGLAKVGDDVFTLCKNLRTITIPEAFATSEILIRWGLPENCAVFSNGEELLRTTAESVKDPNGIRFSKDGKTLLRYPPELNTTHYTIPDGITGIGEKAFSGCTNLKVILIPPSVVFIDHNAFSGVQAVKLLPGNEIFEMDSAGALIDKQEKRLVFFPRTYKGKYVIPDTIRTICGHVFYHCAITELVVPESVEEIEDSAFSNCNSLLSLTIPDKFFDTRIDTWNLPRDCQVNNLTEEEEEEEDLATQKTKAPAAPVQVATTPAAPVVQAYPLDMKKIEADKKRGIIFSANNRSLLRYPTGLPDKSYTVPDGITSLDQNAFFAAQHLTEVTLPKSLRYIGPGAFSSTGMSKILLPENISGFSGTSFGLLEVTLSPDNKFLIQHKDGSITTNGKKKTLLYVPKTLQGTYIVPEDVTTLPYAAFYYCKNLKSIKLHNGIKSIGPSVFNSCGSLRVMQLPAGMTSIPSSLFAHCSSLKYVTIPDTVKVIGDLAFFGCHQLDDVQLPAGLTRIGGQAFQGCASLRKIKLPDSLILIGGQAFSGCSSLKELVIPDSVESIGHGAFSGCTSLKSISFPAHFTRDYIRKLNLPAECKIKRRAKMTP